MTNKTWFIAGAAATVLLGWTAQIAYFVVYGPSYPVNLQLRGGDCQFLAHGTPKDAKPVPCKFTVALFHSDAGWVGYGLSDNVKGQCLYMAYQVVDPDTFDIQTDGDRIAKVPDKCQREFADLHPRSRPF